LRVKGLGTVESLEFGDLLQEVEDRICRVGCALQFFGFGVWSTPTWRRVGCIDQGAEQGAGLREQSRDYGQWGLRFDR